MTKVFIDGSAGTTGLRIYERLSDRKDIELLTLSEELRKNSDARRQMLNLADIAFLCLPDKAAIEAVSLIENDRVAVIDTSTAHRTNEAWAYGFAELSDAHREKIRCSKRIANPGCHASGFISTVYPLVAHGVIPADFPLTAYSLTGYSGGGKSLIAEYEDANRDVRHESHRIYGTTLQHKHLPEMQKICGLAKAPVFSPILGDFYAGMATSVLLPASMHKRSGSACPTTMPGRKSLRWHPSAEMKHWSMPVPMPVRTPCASRSAVMQSRPWLPLFSITWARVLPVPPFRI